MFLKNHPLETFQEESIVEAIRNAEKRTSGEIRVHIENNLKGRSIEELAMNMFEHLEMKNTKERNGILFLVSFKERRFAILGDEGIHAKVGQSFWDDVKLLMTSCFKRGDVVQGIVAGIGQAGEKLQKYFPYESDDVNELSDEISFG